MPPLLDVVLMVEERECCHCWWRWVMMVVDTLKKTLLLGEIDDAARSWESWAEKRWWGDKGGLMREVMSGWWRYWERERGCSGKGCSKCRAVGLARGGGLWRLRFVFLVCGLEFGCRWGWVMRWRKGWGRSLCVVGDGWCNAPYFHMHL
jgi:hypothetical protein